MNIFLGDRAVCTEALPAVRNVFCLLLTSFGGLIFAVQNDVCAGCHQKDGF